MALELVGNATLKSHVTASSYQASYPPSYAFDGDFTISNYWGPTSAPNSWLKFDLLDNYKITAVAVEGVGVPNEAPKDCELFGSNTGAFSGEQVSCGAITFTSVAYGGWSSWANLSNPGTYRYYKLVIYNVYTGAYFPFLIAEVKFQYVLPVNISGTLKTKESDVSGVAADYAIIKRSDGSLLAAGTAAAGGTYSEVALDNTTEYDVTMLDPNGTYNPKIIGEKVTGV